MTDALNTPGFTDDDRCVLDPSINEGRLRSVYSDMADILLQLSKKSFERIGSKKKMMKQKMMIMTINELGIIVL